MTHKNILDEISVIKRIFEVQINETKTIIPGIRIEGKWMRNIIIASQIQLFNLDDVCEFLFECYQKDATSGRNIMRVVKERAEEQYNYFKNLLHPSESEAARRFTKEISAEKPENKAHFFNRIKKHISLVKVKKNTSIEFNYDITREDLEEELRTTHESYKFRYIKTNKSIAEYLKEIIEFIDPFLPSSVSFGQKEVAAESYKSNNVDDRLKKTLSSRVIDSDKLKIYFKNTFKGGGNNNHDHFGEMIESLKNEYSDKDFARIAYLIYTSTKLNDREKPGTFKKWYEIFCESIGIFPNKGYKPNNLKIDSEHMIKKVFEYI